MSSKNANKKAAGLAAAIAGTAMGLAAGNTAAEKPAAEVKKEDTKADAAKPAEKPASPKRDIYDPSTFKTNEQLLKALWSTRGDMNIPIMDSKGVERLIPCIKAKVIDACKADLQGAPLFAYSMVKPGDANAGCILRTPVKAAVVAKKEEDVVAAKAKEMASA